MRARMRAAEAGWGGIGKNIQAGGFIRDRDRHRAAATLALAKRLAATALSALEEYGRRLKTAMGTRRKKSRQDFQRCASSRMSAPMSQTNRV